MFSRAGLLVRQQPKFLPVLTTRATQTSVTKAGDETSGERDLVNFPRPVRAVEPGKVRLGFVPEEWFQLFYKKTGVTGPYAFGVGLATYLCSKEIYVMEHEYYSGLSIAIIVYLGIKKLGPGLSSWADKEIEKYEASWREGRENEQTTLEEGIKGEKTAQWQAEGQIDLMNAKRENVQFQLEAAYRERLATAYKEVKRRLDYQVEKFAAERRIAQTHMINWVVAKVLSSLTSEQEKDTFNMCINELSNLAKKQT